MPGKVTEIGGNREGGPGGQIFQVPNVPDLSSIYSGVRVTANYRVGGGTGAQRFVLVDATNGPVSITLPDLTSSPQTTAMPVTVKKIDSSGNAVTVRTSGAALIDGASTKALTAANQSVTVVPFGKDWWVV